MLLARSQCRTLPLVSFESGLLSLNGFGDGVELPVAALTALVDQPSVREASWLRADPVYLRADMHKLLMFDATTFELDEQEAADLINGINTELNEVSVRLTMGTSPKRWYIALDENTDLLSWPPSSLAGRSSFEYLPGGRDANRWRRIGNEVQMILHESTINETRRQRGDPPVNSIWLWGAGELRPFDSRFDVIVADDELARGIATHCGATCYGLPNDEEDVGVLAQNGDTLLVLDQLASSARYGDVGEWLARLRAFDETWLAACVALLRKRKISRLEIYTEGFCILATPGDLSRWWRRRRRLPIDPAHKSV